MTIKELIEMLEQIEDKNSTVLLDRTTNNYSQTDVVDITAYAATHTTIIKTR